MNRYQPPPWLKDRIAREEWCRLASTIPSERHGVLANYCAVHARLAKDSTDGEPKSVAALAEAYSVLVRVLFGNASPEARPESPKEETAAPPTGRELIPVTNIKALRAAGLLWPASVDAWRWLYRHREVKGMSQAFRKVGGRVLVDVDRFRELTRGDAS